MATSYRTVRRVVEILQLMASSQTPLRLTDIATTLDIPFSSAHALLQELTKEGMTCRVKEREYEPGIALVALSVQMTRRLAVLEAARPVMVDLMLQTTQDVYLAVPSGVGMMYVYRTLGPGSLRLEIPLGVPRPLHSTSVGQLYLAQLPPAQCDELIDSLDLVAVTPHTLTDPRALRERVEGTRRRGAAVTDQESVDGIMAFAAPIFNCFDELAGALSLSVFCTLGGRRQGEFIDKLMVASAEVSRRMGWRSPAPTVDASGRASRA